MTEPVTELDQLKKQLRLARLQRHYLEDGRGYARGDLSKLTQCRVIEQEEAILEKKIAALEANEILSAVPVGAVRGQE